MSEKEEALLAAAETLEALPPMLKEQYVATLRLYAAEPWRMAWQEPDTGPGKTVRL